jgi:hypothetical protein
MADGTTNFSALALIILHAHVRPISAQPFLCTIQFNGDAQTTTFRAEQNDCAERWAQQLFWHTQQYGRATDYCFK